MRIVTVGAARMGPIRAAESRQAVLTCMPAPISGRRRIEHDGPASARTGAVPSPE